MSIVDTLLRACWHPDHSPGWFSRRIHKQLVKRQIDPGFEFRADFYGLKYDGRLDNVIDIDIFYFGAFEKPMLHFLRNYVQASRKPNMTFVDVGANIGQHSLFMSTLVDRVHAFEPYPPVRERMDHQIAINHLTNIVVHPVGLGKVTSQQPFYAPTGTNLGVGSFDAGTVHDGNEMIGELSIVRSDEYFPAHDIRDVDIVKIDVEGLEKEVIEGLQETLGRCRPVLLTEIAYGHQHSFTSMADLKRHFPPNYEFFVFSKRKKNGKKARRQEARNRSTGHYRLVPFTFQFAFDQDDIVAIPEEQLPFVPFAG